MKLSLDINSDTLYADTAGEALMQYFVDNKSTDRWGYTTRDFGKHIKYVTEANVYIDSELLEATFCCGFYDAHYEYMNIAKYILADEKLAIYLYWEGDGTILIKHLTEDWMLVNYDVKKAYGWKWADEEEWVKDLPGNYYEEEGT